MQDDQHALAKAKYQPCDPLAGQGRPDLPEAIFQITHQRHPHGPAELYPHQVKPDGAAVTRLKSPQPLPYRFIASLGAVELCWNLRGFIHNPIMYQN